MSEYSELRGADLAQLVKALKAEHDLRYDVVVPAQGVSMEPDGDILVAHMAEPDITDSGVTAGHLEMLKVTPTIVADEQLGERLGIPRAYYRRCRDTATDLLALNVNHWLEPDERSFYLRTLKGGGEDPGLLRAVMSDRFRPMDNLDITMAALAGIKAAGVTDTASLVVSADLSIRRMYINLEAPLVNAHAPDLVQNYTDPRSGRQGRDFGVVSAGVSIRNSDVGQGAFQISPRIVFLVCKNGMTRAMDAVRSVHLGGKLSEGLVDWSDETMRRSLKVIESQTTDAVGTFLSPEYLERVVDELRNVNRKDVKDPIECIQEISTQLKFTADEQQLILMDFIKGHDLSPLGVAQAVTSVARNTVAVTADRAAELEDAAWESMLVAAGMAA